jgi:hypothetical protein
MRKLNKLFNSLHSFDKNFLEIFYRLEYKISSKRFFLFNLFIKNKCGDADYLDEFKKDSDALAQNKRRLGFDIESLLLFHY